VTTARPDYPLAATARTDFPLAATARTETIFELTHPNNHNATGMSVSIFSLDYLLFFLNLLRSQEHCRHSQNQVFSFLPRK
jgi:hypothetical protein